MIFNNKNTYESFEAESNVLYLRIANDRALLEQIYLKDPEVYTESFKDIISNVWTKVLQLLNNLKTFLNNLVLNINYIKRARLPQLQNRDLIKVLQELEPRTLTGNIKVIDKFLEIIDDNGNPYQSVSDFEIDKTIGNKDYSDYTSLEYEMDKSTLEIKNSINVVTSLPESIRLQSERYENTNVQNIPLNIIIKDCKDSRDNCTAFENRVIRITRNRNLIDNPKYKELADKALGFCKANIDYYQMRIKFLYIFFKSARISLSTKNSLDMRLSISSKMNNYIDFSKEYSSNELNTILNIRDRLYDLDSKNDFRTYYTQHRILCNMLKIPENSIIVIDKIIGNTTIQGYYYNDFEERIPVTGKPLFHYSSSGIRNNALYPTCIGNGTKTLYPTPRVYVHISIPLNKFGKQINKAISVSTNKIETKESNGNIYEVDQDIDYVYKDPEMGGTGAYILTSKPVKVKPFDYNKFMIDNKFF